MMPLSTLISFPPKRPEEGKQIPPDAETPLKVPESRSDSEDDEKVGAISETMHGDCEYNHMVNFNNKILLSIADDKHIHSREQEVKLNRLSNLLPAFAIFLSHSCCFPRNLPGQMLLLYREQIRFNMLPQDERKNSLLAAFHMRYRKDLDELGAFLMYGRPVCPSCYRGLYDISLSDFQRTLKLVKRGNSSLVSRKQRQ